ncbi:hypothetical protein MOD25_08125 [Bacillus haynesii]|uniref:hypothetical protein n=1 Tax=Bacillus haynesii TaxID=1925021 RepID=UPI002282CDED|nr:hypothetical protein [Bacillus haynesii]MCY8549872.1 hypothetical protein [Bacillus haynesii]MCY9182798.1 hypothetical protein [Bacillus haynesii]
MFANCVIPYDIGETIKSREKLLLRTAQGIQPQQRSCENNRDKKTVTVGHLTEQKEYEDSHDVLVLSSGPKPIVPPIPGLAQAENLLTLRMISNTDQIKHYIDSRKPKKAGVYRFGIGGKSRRPQCARDIGRSSSARILQSDGRRAINADDGWVIIPIQILHIEPHGRQISLPYITLLIALHTRSTIV